MASKGSFHQTQQRQSSHEIVMHSSTTSAPENFISAETGAYDLGELDQAFFLYLEGQDHASVLQDQRQSSGGTGHILDIFPSQPTHVEPSTKVRKLEEKEEMDVETSTKRTVDFVSPTPTSSVSKRPPETSMELPHPRNVPTSASQDAKHGVKRKCPTSTSEHGGEKTKDSKSLRRLAQNREAARRSRLRKKAYVQQLESSRIKLAQLEQELQRTRAQGPLLGSGIIGEQGQPAGVGCFSSDAVVFDMEYARWLDEHHRLMCNLRTAVEEQLQENELRMFVDNCLAHYDQMMNLKSMMVKSDVFHIVSGMWMTPAERCFLWMGGFRPSEFVKIILNEIGPLMEQKILLGICSLQQSTQAAEEALTQGLEALRQSLYGTIASADALSCPSNIANYMGSMAIAMNKLSTLESFVGQADDLRQQTVHRIHQILPTSEAARFYLAIAEYFHRLRVLSSLWLSRPKQD